MMESNHNLMISRREVLGTLFRYKWSIAAIIIGTFALATFLVYFLISPSFASRAVIIINSSYLTQPLRDAPPDSDLEKLVTFHTQRDVLESQRLAEEAVKRTNLGETRVIGNIERIKMFVGDVKRSVGKLLNIERWTKPWDPDAAAVAAVDKWVSTAAVPDSKAIEIIYRSKNAQESANTLNALLQAHKEYYYDVIRANAAGIFEFLNNEFTQSQVDLAAAEKELLDFRMQDKLEIDNGKGQEGSPTRGTSFTGISNNTEVQQELKLYVLKLEDELRASKEIVDNDKRNRIRKDLQTRITKYLNVLNELPERELTLTRLTRNYEQAQEHYLLLKRNLTRAKLVASGETENMMLIEVFEAAEPKETPVFPKKRMSVILGVIVGGMLALTYAFLSAYLDQRFYSAADIQKRLGLRVLSSIPEIS